MPLHFVILLIALTICNLSTAEAAKTPSAIEEATDRAALMELTRPGPEHARLKAFSGKWKVKLSIGSSNNTPPLQGVANAYMTMEDRFLWIGYQAKYQTRAFKGSFTIGFDRRHQHYVLIAMDTSGTYFVTSKGEADPDSGLIKLYGQDDDPYMESLGYTKEFAHVLDLTNPDHFSILVIFVDTRTPERRESTGMTFEFTRRSTTEKN